MNTTLSAQSASSRTEERKRKHRELDLKSRAQLAAERLKRKDSEELKRERVEQRIKERLHESPAACDMLISMLVAALFSYRRGIVCEPFPPDHIDSKGEKDFSLVEMYTQAIPSTSHFQKHEEALKNLPLSALKLLSWMLDLPFYEEFSLEQISLDQYRQETNNIDMKQSKYSDPTYVFKVKYSDEHIMYPAFCKAKSEWGSTIGFHGSAFENLHSILRNGLDSTFGKETSLFGEGIYLSSDRDVAFSFLGMSRNQYKNSLLGDKLGVLVCAEVACHPKLVRLSPEEARLRNLEQNVDRQLPKGYIVAETNEHVSIKYVLLYHDNNGAGSKSLSRTSKKQTACILVAVIYVVVLIGLWMARDPHMRHYIRTLGQV